MNGIHIRAATFEDATIVAQLAPSEEDMRQTAPREQAPIDTDMVVQWMRERHSGFVLERGGEILAYGELNENPDQPNAYWIGHVMVRPAQRGAGFGRTLVGALLKHSLVHLKARDVRISAFEDNPAAVRCYLACGFQEVGRRRFDGRILVDMRYRDASTERVLPRPAAALMVVAASGLTALLLPTSARFWVQDMSGDLPGFSLIIGSFIAGIVGYAFHPLLPRRNGTLVERLLLPVIYASAVAIVSAFIAVVLFFVLARLGLGVGAGLLRGAQGHLGGEQPLEGMPLILQILSQSLAYGAGWGMMLSALTYFIERRR